MPTHANGVGIFYPMTINLEQANNAIQAWGNQAAGSMQALGASMGIQHREGSPSPKPSLQQVVARYKYATGLVHIVSFRVPRSLIYTHKGAGKGRGGNVGSSWADKYGQTKKTNPKSMGKMGTAGRTEKPFFNNTMQDPALGIDALGDILVIHIGDAIVNNLLIK